MREVRDILLELAEVHRRQGELLPEVEPVLPRGEVPVMAMSELDDFEYFRLMVREAELEIEYCDFLKQAGYSEPHVMRERAEVTLRVHRDS